MLLQQKLRQVATPDQQGGNTKFREAGRDGIRWKYGESERPATTVSRDGVNCQSFVMQIKAGSLCYGVGGCVTAEGGGFIHAGF